MATLLTVDDLAFGFPDAPDPVIDGLSFTMAPSEFLGVVGGSGVGKSTLLRIIAGLLPAMRGTVTLAGERDPARRRRAMVFQDARLMPWRRVHSNVAYGLEGLAISRQERDQRVSDALELVGLSEYAGRWPAQLSGGQRQRVGIARALAVKPDLLLMDEPFSAVDAITRRNLQDELIRVWQAARTAIIFVTHDINEATFLADRVIVLGGKPAGITFQAHIDEPRPRKRDRPDLLQDAADIAGHL